MKSKKLKTAVISVQWDNSDSIKAAEKAKRFYENKGYSLVNTFGGINNSVLVYGITRRK